MLTLTAATASRRRRKRMIKQAPNANATTAVADSASTKAWSLLGASLDFEGLKVGSEERVACGVLLEEYDVDVVVELVCRMKAVDDWPMEGEVLLVLLVLLGGNEAECTVRELPNIYNVKPNIRRL